MTFPKRESESTTTTDAAATELSTAELATIDGGFVSLSVGCAPTFVAAPSYAVVGAPLTGAVIVG
jgi:hypothetical protein